MYYCAVLFLQCDMPLDLKLTIAHCAQTRFRFLFTSISLQDKRVRAPNNSDGEIHSAEVLSL